MPDAHALLSLSASAKWLACHGSLAMELPYPNTSSEASEAGTRAHALGEWKIVDATTETFLDGVAIPSPGRPPCDDADMDEHTDAYRDFVLAEAGADPDYFEVEVQVDTGVPDCWGTSDVILVTDRTLKVIDLKYGYRKVTAPGNTQLKGYALGALNEIDGLHDVDKIEVIIFQPRLGWVDRATYTVEEIRAFQQELATAGNHVKRLLLIAKEPNDHNLRLIENTLNPGEKQCEWCRARGSCPALAEMVKQQVSDRPAPREASFEDITVADRDVIAARSADQLAQHMAALPLIESWIKAVRAETEARLQRGEDVTGWKLVQGKKGARKWSDPVAAEAALKGSRLKSDEMYDKTVISPTTAEKLLKDRPRTWAKLQALVTQSEGGEHVAPADDKREAIVKRKPEEVFEDLTEEDPDLAMLGS